MELDALTDVQAPFLIGNILVGFDQAGLGGQGIDIGLEHTVVGQDVAAGDGIVLVGGHRGRLVGCGNDDQVVGFVLRLHAAARGRLVSAVISVGLSAVVAAAGSHQRESQHKDQRQAEQFDQFLHLILLLFFFMVYFGRQNSLSEI